MARGREVTVRIWNGCRVVALVSSDGEGGSTMIGSVGGAEHSIKVDIDLDPWAGLIVDRRVEHPVPVRIQERLNESEEA